MYPGLESLSESEQYLLYCYFYGRCLWRVTVQPTSPGGNVISLHVSPNKRVESPEVIRSPTSAEIWNSEASVWSFSPLPHGRPAWKFSPAPERRSLGKPLRADETTAWSFAPRPENEDVVEFVPSRRLYKNQQKMGLPKVVDPSVVYRQYGDQAHDSIDFVESQQLRQARVMDNSQPYPVTEVYAARPENEEVVSFEQVYVSHLSPKSRRKKEQQHDDLSPVEYSKRRQTSVKMARVKSNKANRASSKRRAENFETVAFDQVTMSHLSPKSRRKTTKQSGNMSPVQYSKRRQTSVKMARVKSNKENRASTRNAENFETVPFQQVTMSHLSPRSHRRYAAEQSVDLQPVQYTKRRQTSVKTAQIKSHKENRTALMNKAESYYKHNPGRSPKFAQRDADQQHQVRNRNPNNRSSEVLTYFQLPPQQTSL